LLLQKRGEKELLYVVWNSKNGFTIIDVTDPRHPNVVKDLAWPNDASAGKLQMVGSEIALAEAPDSDAGTSPSISRTEPLNVLDLSDPADPQTIRSFSSVTSFLTDTTHNLVYITNSEGLWILRNNQTSGEVAKQHACSTSDASDDEASCQ